MTNLEIKKWNITISSTKKWITVNIAGIKDEETQNMFFDLPSKIDTKTTQERLLEIFVEVFKKYNTDKK